MTNANLILNELKETVEEAKKILNSVEGYLLAHESSHHCGCKAKQEQLKTNEEITLGERLIIELLKNKSIKIEEGKDITEAALKYLATNPFVKTMEKVIKEDELHNNIELSNAFYAFVSCVTEELLSVDGSKLRVK